MRPVINVISGTTHCDHGHLTVKSATHCRRVKMREAGAVENLPTLRAMTIEQGRYIKVDGNLVTA